LTEMLKAFYGGDDLPFEVQVFSSFVDAQKWFGVLPTLVSNSPNQPPAGHNVLHSLPGYPEDPGHVSKIAPLR
jgi:hypothetical protein